jgi:hypothetical protein
MEVELALGERLIGGRRTTGSSSHLIPLGNWPQPIPFILVLQIEERTASAIFGMVCLIEPNSL